MGIEEEERQSTPPPWGWPPAQKENAHGVEEIVYDGSCNTNHQTKDRRHEQEKACHKTRRRATPHGQAARNPRVRLEPVREPVRPDIAAAFRESPRLRVPRPKKARPRVQGRDPLHEGLRLVRERRRQELQQARQEMVSEGNRLQPAHEAPDPTVGELDQLNP